MHNVIYNTTGKKINEKDMATALECGCFFCGEDRVLTFFLQDIKKVVCFNCVDSKEVDQFYKMKGIEK